MSKFKQLFEQFVTEALDLGKDLEKVYEAKGLEEKQEALLSLMKKLKKPTKSNLLDIKVLEAAVGGKADMDNLPPNTEHLFDEKAIDKYATNLVLKGQGMGTI